MSNYKYYNLFMNHHICIYRLKLAVNSLNGGRLQMKYYHNSYNYDIKTKYYSGQTTSHAVSFTFDFDPPYHCLQMCTKSMLQIGPSFTSQVQKFFQM